jgi:hypothetical protein
MEGLLERLASVVLFLCVFASVLWVFVRVLDGRR